MIFLYRKDDGKGDFSVNEAEKSSFFVYASSEKNRMLACRFGEHRDNSRNSQSVFLVVMGFSLLSASEFLPTEKWRCAKQ